MLVWLSGSQCLRPLIVRSFLALCSGLRTYCWPCSKMYDISIMPYDTIPISHLLATDGPSNLYGTGIKIGRCVITANIAHGGKYVGGYGGCR
ncbi:hypothetical protein F5X99DRAFT_385818 [Biscogniauxia marginata]|nr:hypothetical protein F5X99DRAFT_385818 [Biscogniauxia marginata]